MRKRQAVIFRNFEEVSDTVETLLAALMMAREHFGMDTETMIRMYCQGFIKIGWDEERESVKVEFVPQGRVA